MPDVRVGSLSEYGIGTEGTEGTPVKAQHLLGVNPGSTLRPYPDVLAIDEETGVRSLRAYTYGSAYGMGGWTLPVRHDKFTKVLLAHFGSPSSGGSGPYTHIFKTKQVLAALTHPHTLYQNRGQGRLEVFSGAYAQSLGLAVARDARILTATVNWMTQLHPTKCIWDYSTENRALVVDGSAAYDDDNPWVYDKGTFSLHGTAVSTVRSFNVTRAWAMEFDDPIRPTRGVNGVIYGGVTLTGAIDMIYSTEAEFKRFMGAAAPSDPYGAAQAIVVGTLKLDFSGAGVVYAGEGFTIEIDEAVWSLVDQPLATRDGLIQRCEYIGLYDSTDVAEMKLTVINSEAEATVIAAGTNIA